MEVVFTRARRLLYRFGAPTIVLAIVSGLVGGLALAAWTASRRTTGVLDRFLEYAEVPQLNVTFCPPEVTTVNEENLGTCFAYDQAGEVDQVRSLPGVRVASRAVGRLGRLLGTTGAAEEEPPPIVEIAMMRDLGIRTPQGRPIVVRGRLADQEADDEVVVNEVFAEARRVDVGQQIDIQLLTAAEVAQQPDAPPGPTIRLRVAGIVRSLGDLSSKLAGSASDELILTSPGLEARVEGAAVFYGAIFMLVDDPVAVRRAVAAAFPGRLFGVSGNIARDDVAALQGTYDYEARAAMAVAVIAAVAGLIFVGQTLARQVRREWTDLASLRSIGMSDAQIGATALTRGVPIAVGAVAIAAVVALALSARSPVGLARAAEVRPGVLTDLFVMVVGLPLLAVAILLVAWFPVWRLARAPRRRRGHTAAVGNLGLPPSAAVGVTLAANGGRGGTGLPMGTALVGTALAVLAVTAAISVAASLDAVVEQPESYGATWDVSVSALDNDEPVGLRERITDLPGITGASIMRGADLEIAGDSVWTVALEPVDSERPGIEPRIVEGRAPTGPDEIALGGLTLAATGLRVGDQVEVTSSVVGADPTSASIVGVAVVNATDESSPGYGAVMSRRGLTRLAPEAGARLFLFDLADGGDGAAALAELRSDPNLQVAGPVLQPAVRNVVRLRKLVLVLASIVAILAAASLAHALLASSRRNRGQLAILKSVGFTRRQIAAAVAAEATAIALPAAVVGVPLGLLVAHWGWSDITSGLGLASPLVVPLLALGSVVLVLVALANVVAVGPGWRAARVRPAEALRAE